MTKVLRKLTILQWNLKSTKSNRDNLKILNSEYSPDIILLNETFLKHSDKFNFKNFIIYRDDRDDGYGGIAILVKPHISHSLINVNPTKFPNNFQIMSIKLLDFKFSIINIYNPPTCKIRQSEFISLIQSIDSSFILMGDLNSHHRTWGSSKNDINGTNILNSLDELKAVIINDGTPTRINLPGQNKSALDISLVSTSLAHNCSWQIIPDCGSSDHLPTLCTFNTQKGSALPLGLEIKINLKQANWPKYSQEIDILLPSETFQSNKDTSFLAYNLLMKTMKQALINVSPHPSQFNRKTQKPRYISPWWDDDCKVALKNRIDAHKNFKSSPTLDNFIKLKKYIAISKKLFLQKKRTKFLSFCESFNRNTPTSHIWRSYHRFSGKLTKQPQQRANSRLSMEILNSFNVCNIDPNFQILPIEQDFEPITIHELTHAINLKTKDTAQGLDELSYSMFKWLSPSGISLFLRTLNQCIQKGKVPHQWKDILIIPILKPSRNPLSLSSFRAIALSSCACKLFESIIKKRVEWELENQKLLPPTQFGFRALKGCTDALNYLHSSILESFGKDNFALAIFLDINSAYDNVNCYLLYKKLIELGIPPSLSNIIFELQANRRMFIRDNYNNTLGPQTTSRGLGQGSPLSPLLFNIYTISLHNNFNENVQLIQYADDLVLLSSGNNPQTLFQKISPYLEKTSKWLTKHNFSLSRDKSSAILFRKGHSNKDLPVISIQGEIIKWVKQIKYLGIHFSYNLNWMVHTRYLKDKTSKRINILRALCGTKWGGDPATLLTLYKSIILSQLDYGSQLFRPSSKQSKKTLDKIQYCCLRLILGCMKSTPIYALISESGETTLDNRRKWLAGKYILKTLADDHSPLIPILHKLLVQRSNPSNKYWKCKEPSYLMEAIRNTNTFMDRLYTFNVHPKFEIELYNQLTPIRTHIEKKNFINSAEFMNHYRERYKDYKFFYTDGSVDPINMTAGFGVHCQEINFNYASRLHNGFQICSAEMIAIHKAIEIVLNKELRKAIIFTDSQSAIQKLLNTSNNRIDHISGNTRRLLVEAGLNGCDIRIIWCPSHAGIEGNETADKLALIGRKLNIAQNLKIPHQELQHVLKKKLQIEHSINSKDLIKNKQSFYLKVHPTATRKPWFLKMGYMSRRHITTIIRLKTGHCHTPTHLFRIGIKEDPFCQCGEVGTLTHYLFECTLHDNPNINLYSWLSAIHVPTPISIVSLLQNLTEPIINCIITYLEAKKIQI